MVLGGATVTEGRFVGGRGLLLCGACIGAMFIHGFMGAAVGCTLGSDILSDGRMCGAIGVAVEVTLVFLHHLTKECLVLGMQLLESPLVLLHHLMEESIELRM